MVLLRAPFLSFVITTLLVSLFYGNELSQPNAYFLGNKEDGVKNYYTLAYHQEFDSSFTQFGGMSYPYGEHIVFTDGQPILSAVLWAIPPLAPYSIAVINLLMLLGIGLSAWILCKLFIRLGLTRGSSIFAALAISLLSPQILRFTGHYALAYSFILPWIIYVAYLYMHGPLLKRSIWVFLAMGVAIGLHLYFFLIGAAYILIFYLAEQLRSPKQSWLKTASHTAFQVFVPFILYMTWLALSDDTRDRPGAPYGMREFMAYWEGVFLPYFQYMDQSWFQGLKVREMGFESWSYAGLPAGLYFIYFLLSRVSLFKKEKRTFDVGNSMLLAGFVVFLFAATFPFTLSIDAVNNIAGPLKQFRSLGRLSWIFFYVLNIFMFYHLAGRRKLPGMILTVLAILIMSFEGLNYLWKVKGMTGFERTEYPELAEAIQPDEVIFPLPYFHNGAENLMSPVNELYMAEPSMYLSLQSGNPTFGTLLSRVSVSQSLKQLELANNLSGPLMELETPWFLFHSPAYSNRVSALVDWKANANGFNYAHSSAAALSVSKESTRPNTLNDSLFISLKTTQSNLANRQGEAWPNIPSIPHLGGEATWLCDIPAHADSLDLAFWIDANYDGFRNQRLLVKHSDGSEERIPLDGLYDNVLDGKARIVLKKRLYTATTQVYLFTDGHDKVPAEVYLLRLYPSGYDYVFDEAGMRFTPEFVYKSTPIPSTPSAE